MNRHPGLGWLNPPNVLPEIKSITVEATVSDSDCREPRGERKSNALLHPQSASRLSAKEVLDYSK
jgi:hypothetical protein